MFKPVISKRLILFCKKSVHLCWVSRMKWSWCIACIAEEIRTIWVYWKHHHAAATSLSKYYCTCFAFAFAFLYFLFSLIFCIDCVRLSFIIINSYVHQSTSHLLIADDSTIKFAQTDSRYLLVFSFKIHILAILRFLMDFKHAVKKNLIWKQDLTCSYRFNHKKFLWEKKN